MPTELHAPVRVSVIIPTLNAGAALGELLRRLRGQTLPPHEIIVADSSSEDGSAQLAAEHGAKVMNVPRAEFDHGGTRNAAADLASGEILVFMTQDALPEGRELLSRLVQPMFGSERIVCSYARQLPYENATPIEKLSREHHYPAKPAIKSKADIDRLGIKTFICSNVCAAIRRDIFERMGQFQSPVIFNEDLFMAARCILNGYEVAYAADAAVYHSHNYTAAQQFRRYFDNGVSMSLNEWIAPYSAIWGAGGSLVAMQFRKLVRNRQWRWVPKLILESAAKLAGFKLGFHHRRLPAWFCRKCSMHRLIWNKLERTSGGKPLTPS